MGDIFEKLQITRRIQAADFLPSSVANRWVHLYLSNVSAKNMLFGLNSPISLEISHSENCIGAQVLGPFGWMTLLNDRCPLSPGEISERSKLLTNHLS